MDYNKTINLPKTDCPMRAGLPNREPGMLQRWNDMDLYHELLKKNEGKPRFALHDGPPFSNGNLHMATTPPISPAGITTACPSSPPSSRSRSSTARR